MPPRHRFYEPIVQNPSPETPDRDPSSAQLEALFISTPGVYLPLEGAIAYLLAAAEQWDDDGNPSGGLALRAVAEAWAQALPEAAPVVRPTPPENGVAAESDEVDTGAAPALTVAPPIPDEGLIVSVQDAYRVEVYPDDPDAPRPRWHARSVDTQGRILYVTGGSFDQESVIKDANNRWPGRDILLVADAYADSIWEEQAPAGAARGVLTHRRRPSPNRMFGS